jgi:hypothetical protein
MFNGKFRMIAMENAESGLGLARFSLSFSVFLGRALLVFP